MACIEYPLCKYAHYGKNGDLLCISGRPCTFQKYCSSLLKNIHTSSYRSCKEMNNLAKKKSVQVVQDVEPIQEEEIQEIEEVQEVEQNIEIIEDIIEHVEVCKARYDNGLMYINFKGYGLVCPARMDKKGIEEVSVYYEGEIGQPDFKFRV